MDNSTNPEIDPWATMGNMSVNQPGEASPENLEKAAAWEKSMSDAPNFAGEQNANNEQNENEYDQSISDASAIINYGLNAAARETSVESVIQTINNFVPNGNDKPIEQLFLNLGIDTEKEKDDLKEEQQASKTNENAFLSSNNAPSTTKKSTEGALQAIKEVKELVAEVQTSPEYANLRLEASAAGKGVFEYAVSKYAVRDLTVLFKVLSEQKRANKASGTEGPEQPPETNKNAENIDENQISNQQSTEKSSPETDATASAKPPTPLYL